MDELLEALKEGDQEQINQEAQRLFLMRNGGVNKAQINEFEHYAPCKIFVLENEEHSSCAGGICYNDRTYMFG